MMEASGDDDYDIPIGLVNTLFGTKSQLTLGDFSDGFKLEKNNWIFDPVKIRKICAATISGVKEAKGEDEGY